MRSTLWFAVAAAAMLAGCAPAQETAEQRQARMDAASAAAKTAIDSLNKEFAVHFNAGHADMVAERYTEQGRMMQPNGPEAVGRKAIAAGLAGMAAMKPDLKLTAQSVLSDGMEALERGTYTLSLTPPGAKAPISDAGKYLVHWQNVGGHWLMADDIWNSDMPPMPMGAPAPAPAKKP
jgi:ketosteroid isomerase-like protein